MIFSNKKRPFFLRKTALVLFGSPGRTRTANLVVNSHPLCRLSYQGTGKTGSFYREKGRESQDFFIERRNYHHKHPRQNQQGSALDEYITFLILRIFTEAFHAHQSQQAREQQPGSSGNRNHVFLHRGQGVNSSFQQNILTGSTGI